MADLHHLLLAGIGNSYALFPPGGILPVNDFAETVMRLVGQSFSIGMQMAAPFVIGGIILNVALGVLSRLEDQLTSWEPSSSRVSPDRLDALVWALTDLVVEPQRERAPLRESDHDF